MSNNARDEQFKGFAGMLAKELRDQGLLDIGNAMKPFTDPPIDLEYEKIKEIIARRAYDLALHVVAYLGDNVMQRMEKGYILSEIINNDVPDMAELPKEQEPTMQIMGEYIAENETVTFPGDPDRQPRKISVTLDNGDIFEGIVHYAGNVTEQEP